MEKLNYFRGVTLFALVVKPYDYYIDE